MENHILPFLEAALIDEAAPNTAQGQATDVPYAGTSGSRKRLLVKYKVENSAIFQDVLLSVSISTMSWGYAFREMYVSVLTEDFDVNTVTWNTRPAKSVWGDFVAPYAGHGSGNTIRVDVAAANWSRIRDCAVYGFELSYSERLQDGQFPHVETSSLVISYDPLQSTLSNLSPGDGAFIHKAKENTFGWGIETNAQENNPPKSYWPTQENATLYWRASESSSTSSIPAGTESSVTVPAGTFNSGAVQWRVVAELSDGSSIATDWIVCTTEDALSTPIPVSPNNTVIDGSVENVILWEHSISTGTEQTAFDLQIKTDTEEWATVLSQSTASTSAAVPRNTFPGGNAYWRVRTYNAENVAGSWSEAAPVFVIAAPNAPAVAVVDSSPRFSIRWQQSGQQAYELQLDEEMLDRRFGAESSYQYEHYLSPGSYTVRVRIQNQYGLWSDWGSAALHVSNTESEAIVLAVTSGNTAKLSWNTTGAYDKYLVYRNGILIGESTLRQFVDNFSVGDAEYQVRGVHTGNGYYTLSNTVTVTISPETLLIADVSDPVWISLPLSASSLRSASLSASQSVTYTHYVGNGLPGAEIGEAVSKSYNLDCAFKIGDFERIRRFEALLGKVVCIKTPSQRRIIGVMSQMSARENRFYAAYSVPITEVRWEEMQT